MPEFENQSAQSPKSSISREPRLRIRGIVILALVIADILLGNQLALARSPFPPGFLIAHVVVSAVVVAFAGHAVWITFQISRWPARAATLLTALASAGATTAGAAFLLEGEAIGPLRGMEVFGGLAVLGAFLMVVIG